jgi:hypothetical protein
MYRPLAVIAAALAGIPLDARPADPAPAPADAAWHVRVGVGGVQGFGEIGLRAPALDELGGPGGALDVGVGWRLDPRFNLVVSAAAAQFDGGSASPSAAPWTLAAGLEAEIHILPDARGDPWLALGVGLRRYAVDRDGGRDEYDGADFFRLRLGCDLRISRRLAIGPALGVALTTFTRQRVEGSAAHDVASPSVGLFAFGGLSGRVDL